MVLALTESQKIQILDLHYSGHSNDEIHNIIGKSTGSISGVITNYIQSLESEDHDSIISLSRSWRKNNMNLKDASTAMSVCGVFKKNNIDIDNLPDISKMFSYIDEKKITLTEFVDSSKQLRDIQNKSDTPLSDIPQNLSHLQDKCESLKEKSEKLEKDIIQQEKILQESIKSKNTTVKELNEFTETRDFLIKSNIDVKNYKKMANMLKSADTQKYNLSKITANLQKENSASDRITQLESKQDRLLVELKSKENTIAKKQTEMSHLASKYEAISKDHDKKKKEIANIESLSKSGVSSFDIKSWNKIISEASMDISKLAESTDSIKQLSNKIQSLDENVNSLQSNVASLKGEKLQLHTQVKKLEAKQEKLLDLGDKIKQMVSDANSYALANTHNLSQKIIQNFSKDITELFEQVNKNTDESQLLLQQHVKKLIIQLEKRTNELLLQDEKINSQAKMLAGMEFLSPMHKIVHGKTAPKSEILAVFSTIVSAMINWSIAEGISHTVFGRSLPHTNESIRQLFSGAKAA
jgi:DNA repair exonuclease SbcCD ATPase subunit